MAAEPCGRVNPQLLRTETGLSKQRINHSLKQLQAAGWITKRTRALYDLVDEAGEHISDAPAAVDGGLLDGWEPDTDANAERARAETQRVYEWLRERGSRYSKSEIIDGCGPDEGVDYWWRAVVRAGLGELVEREKVEYRSGHHDYKALE